MANISEVVDTVLLLDNYNDSSEMLHKSFKMAGFTGPTIVMEDDGFFPEDVISIYQYFCGEFVKSENVTGKPRYFNQINVPDYWEISGNNNMGKINDLSHERGHIFYSEPKHKRLVKVVDWMDDRGIVRVCDHYNRCGALYARTFFNKDGKSACKAYFDGQGKEVLMENYVTGSIILNRDNKVYIYKHKVDLALKILEELNASNAKVYYNSLSNPFFLSNRLDKDRKQDILFWQEGPRNDIPGNMQSIFDNDYRTKRIYVQNRDSYDKLISLGASKDFVKQLGFVYDFAKENTHKKNALICTNSDNVEGLKEVVEAFPKMKFNVVAITEMSSKLLDFGKYTNVNLYPNAKASAINDLFNECDFYLDINHEGEIVSAVKTAFMHNHLILALNSVAHNRYYVASEHIFNNINSLIEFLGKLLDNNKDIDDCISIQRKRAMSEGIGKYKDLIK